MALQDITPVIIVRDAADTLADTLDSLVDFPEVVLFDNGSTDATLDIAGGYPNVRVERGDFQGFGPTKNHAASLARTDWVFSLDSDEAPDAALLSALQAARLDDPEVLYQVDRHNFFMGRRVRHGGWGDDWLVRVYNRRRHGFNAAMVHEQVQVAAGARVLRLGGALEHAAVTQLGQFLVKINRYSELRRQESQRIYPAWLVALKSAWAFLHTYVIRLGVLDGWRGLVIAVSNANGTFFKHMKPLADHATARERAGQDAP